MLKRWIQQAQPIVLAVGFVLIVRTVLGELPGIEGRLFARPPERGDVVVFRLPRDPSTTFVKRLIGLPGDRIQMREGRLYINDELVARRAIGRLDGDLLYIETLPNGREHEIIEISDTQR